jgi:hypothetical protein
MSTTIQLYDPAFRTKTLTNITWGAGGNTLVITDSNISPNSHIEIQVTGTAAQQAGNWSYLYAVGSVTITSSSSESSTLPLAYFID